MFTGLIHERDLRSELVAPTKIVRAISKLIRLYLSYADRGPEVASFEKG